MQGDAQHIFQPQNTNPHHYKQHPHQHNRKNHTLAHNPLVVRIGVFGPCTLDSLIGILKTQTIVASLK